MPPDCALCNAHEGIVTALDRQERNTHELYTLAQATRVDVATILERLKRFDANGGGPHQHQRTGEEDAHAHQRTVDAVLAVLAETQKTVQAFDVGGWVRQNWKVVSVGSLTIIFLAALAGEALRNLLEPVIKPAITKAVQAEPLGKAVEP